MFELGVNLFERYYGTYTEELRPFVETMLNKRVVIALHVERTVSWDHRKLGLPSTRPDLTPRGRDHRSLSALEHVSLLAGALG